MTQLTLYNSLTRRKEPFTPQDPKRVTMYNCGPTVYSYAHIGNARAAVVADVLFRVLRHIYGDEHVIYARNITDVDDKIIASAKELGVPISEITQKYARIYNEDLAALGCLAPTHQPKATEHIGNMIAMIETLIEDGFAYASDGHVFFDVSKYDDYGKLSGNTLEQLRGGDRVGEGETARKKNPADFVLWKPEAGGVGWDAPFGPEGSNMKGRPGWHIECSAMAKATLCDDDYGNTIDIHCGGVDLKFPHHENEKAQSCCANGTEKFANFWVHNEFLNMGSEKMSKSLGNVTLVHDLLKKWDGEVIRLALLKAHYRSELNWSEDLLRESKKNLDDWYTILGKIGGLKSDSINFIGNEEIESLKFDKHLLDDLSINDGLSQFSATVNAANVAFQKYIKSKTDDASTTLHLFRHWITTNANLLGLLQKDPEEWFRGNTSAGDEAKITTLIDERKTVKAAALAAKAAGDKTEMGKQFSRSDEIRDEIAAMGIVLEDHQDGTTTWRKG